MGQMGSAQRKKYSSSTGVSVIIMNDYQQQLMSVIIIDNWHTIYTYIPQSEPCLYTDAGL